MFDSKINQAIQMIGAISAFLAVAGGVLAWTLGLIGAPVSLSMAQASRDIADIRAQISKLTDAVAAMPGTRDWTMNDRALTSNGVAVAALADRLGRDEVQWAQTSTRVDQLTAGTEAGTRRSR